MQIGATNKADLNLFFVTGVYFQPGRLGESSPSRSDLTAALSSSLSNNRGRQSGRRRESKRIVQ
jgi:hypothetical protein